MAQFEPAFNFGMDHEDPKREGKITFDGSRKFPDAVARFGLNSGAHPELKDLGFFAYASDAYPSMPNDQALPLAAETYKHCYWETIGGYSINDQAVANKIYDLSLTDGTVEAVKLAQRAVNVVLGGVPGFIPLADDGVMGPHTLEAINSINPTDLLAVLKAQACVYYRACAAANPSEAKNLAGWLHRASL